MPWLKIIFICALLLAAHAYTEVAWGPSIDELQVGLTHTGEAEYEPGDTVKFGLYIRNVGEKPAKFSYLDYTITKWMPRFVEEEDAFEPIVWLPHTGGGRFYEETLLANESKYLGECWLRPARPGDLITVDETLAYVVPGEFRITGVVHLHCSRAQTTLALHTGAVPFTVATGPESEERTGTPGVTHETLETVLRMLGECYFAQQQQMRRQTIYSSTGYSFPPQPCTSAFLALNDEARAYVRRIAEQHPDTFYGDLAARLLR